MALFKDNDKRYKYHYQVKEISIIFPSETVELPKTRVVDMELIHDYTENIFPIFRIRMIMEPSIYYDILKFKNEVKFNIRLQKWYTEIGSDKKSLLRDVFNDQFDLILDDDDYNPDNALSEVISKSDYNKLISSDRNDLFKTDNIVEFFLFKTDFVRSGKTMINKIFKKTTPADAIAYVASKSNFPPLLMAISDNTTEYNPLIIPPMSAIEALRWIDSYYGLYKEGSIIYFDFDRGYILPYTPKCRAWRKNEIKQTTIIIPSKTSSYSTDSCSMERITDKEMYYVIANDFVVPRNRANTQGALIGNNVVSIAVNSGNIKLGEVTGDAVVDRMKILEDRTENPYYQQTYTNQAAMEGVVLEIYVTDFDMKVFTPNKEYIVVFEDSKYTAQYKGKYLLTAIAYTFSKDGEALKLAAKLVLKKKRK